MVSIGQRCLSEKVELLRISCGVNVKVTLCSRGYKYLNKLSQYMVWVSPCSHAQ